MSVSRIDRLCVITQRQGALEANRSSTGLAGVVLRRAGVMGFGIVCYRVAWRVKALRSRGVDGSRRMSGSSVTQ